MKKFARSEKSLYANICFIVFQLLVFLMVGSGGQAEGGGGSSAEMVLLRDLIICSLFHVLILHWGREEQEKARREAEEKDRRENVWVKCTVPGGNA
jgi:hypothetical protein